MMKLISRPIALISLLTLVSILTAIGTVNAANQTYLGIWSRDYLSPHIVNPLLGPGSAFTVEVNATDIPPVIDEVNGGATAFDITVRYDPAILTAQSTSLKSPECPLQDGCLFDFQPPDLEAFVLHRSINNTNGSVQVAAVSLSGAVDGSGTIFRISFEVASIGYSVIEILETDSVLVGPLEGGSPPVAPIPYQDVDGSFDNRPPDAKDIAVVAVVVSPSFATVGDPVTITGTIKNQGVTTEDFQVLALVDFYLPCQTTIGSQTHQLAPGDTTVAIFVWNTVGTTCRTVSTYVEAILLGDIDIDTADNSRTGPTVTLNRPPVALFSIEPSAPVVGQTIQFDATQSNDPDGTIVAYAWSFGDGGTATEKVTTHVYDSTGSYDVTLQVTDGDGALSTRTQQVVAAEPQPLVVSVVCADGTAGEPISCDVSASGGTSPYSGTGTFTRTFAVKGTYTVSFDVNDANLVTATGSDTVFIAPKPLVVSVVCSDGTAGKPISCNVSASGGTSPYTGTGTFQQTFATQGTFTISFTVTDADGASVTGSDTVTIGPQPPAPQSPAAPLLPPVVLYSAAGAIVALVTALLLIASKRRKKPA